MYSTPQRTQGYNVPLTDHTLICLDGLLDHKYYLFSIEFMYTQGNNFFY